MLRANIRTNMTIKAGESDVADSLMTTYVSVYMFKDVYMFAQRFRHSPTCVHTCTHMYAHMYTILLNMHNNL